MIYQDRASEFLASGRIAVVGASDDQNNFGRTVVQQLVDHGITAVPVHPRATSVAGVECYPSISEVPGQVDGVIVMVHAEAAADVVRQSLDRDIRKVWLFKGVGRGSVSDEAIRLCEEAGAEVIAGACPLMFLEPVGGVHRFHRTIRRANRSLARSSA